MSRRWERVRTVCMPVDSMSLTIPRTGTFARVWLVRLKDAKEEDQNKVFALKILRKVDGMRPPLICASSRLLMSMSQ